MPRSRTVASQKGGARRGLCHPRPHGRQGLISSWLSEPTKERGGRSRRHYRIEKSGAKALKESARTAQRLFETIAQNLGGLSWKPPG
jgi:hypothetical protein